MVKEITGKELQSWLDAEQPMQLIDVRTQKEHESGHLAHDIHIPVAHILQEIEQIDLHKTVVIYCRSGIRSYEAVRVLQDELEHANLYNLKRGILAWTGEVIQ